MQRYTTELSKKSRTFVPDMETKIETTNTGGKVLALDGEELVGRLEFSFDGNVMSIDHTYAFKKGMGIGGVLVSAANDYAVSKGLKVRPVCSFASAWYERHPRTFRYSKSSASASNRALSKSSLFARLIQSVKLSSRTSLMSSSGGIIQ